MNKYLRFLKEVQRMMCGGEEGGVCSMAGRGSGGE